MIWIYTVCKDRVYPGSAGQGLMLCMLGTISADNVFEIFCLIVSQKISDNISETFCLVSQKIGFVCLCCCFTAQSTRWGYVEHGQFT